MKTFVYLCITSIIGSGAFLAALSMSNPWPAYAVGFGVWGLFFFGVVKRSQEAAKRRKRERLLDEWLGSQSRGGRNY
ncbi:DUF4407 domain-containing protein [Parapedobacter soli]|uniref:DUF4407 domain-containing protein n=1 Tax=Parapedobacter soli TaxID=416955 RepID=UPI0021C86F08|nr:DUF4407 domain-containing protein [Parapedobacter soli]